MLEVILKRFENPDEVREFEKGRFEIINIGGMTIGRATYEPGWKWSEHVGPAVGAKFCEVEHVGLVVSGQATATLENQEVVTMSEGSVFYVPAVPHDSWVVGDEPYVSLHFLGAEKYTKPDLKAKADVQIRAAIADDSAAIAGVIDEAFSQFRAFYTSEAFAATAPPAETIRERFGAGEIWVALTDEKIVGTVSVVGDVDRLYVRSMAVSPAAQGLGVARKLLDTTENFAIENGFKNLFLYTTPFLASAIRLYELNGFVRGEDVDWFFDTPLFAMEKKLD